MSIVVLAAVVERDGAFLLTRRLSGTHLAGTWEFPGGKCEPGESHEDCLRRELIEELAVTAEIGAEIFTITHAYPEKTVELHFYRCRIHGTPRPEDVGRTESHGCFRLSNWNAEHLLKLVAIVEVERTPLLAKEEPVPPTGSRGAPVMQEGAERGDPGAGSHHDHGP